LTIQDVRNIYELRMALDAEAVAHFCERASAEDRARLKANAEEWKEIKYDEPNRIMSANNKFFAILYEGAGNELSRSIIVSLQTRISLLRAITSRSSNDSWFKEGFEMSLEIVSAIEQGNSRKAVKMVRQYAARSMKFALAVLSQMHPQADAEPSSRSKRTARKVA
jgi:GntR family transcriptional regulator, trigonelline degradation regulator